MLQKCVRVTKQKKAYVSIVWTFYSNYTDCKIISHGNMNIKQCMRMQELMSLTMSTKYVFYFTSLCPFAIGFRGSQFSDTDRYQF